MILPERETALTRLAQRVQDEQGYLVMRWIPGPIEPPKPGCVIDPGLIAFGRSSHRIPVKLMCIGEASRQEYIAQASGYCPGAAYPPTPGELFFKVIAE